MTNKILKTVAHMIKPEDVATKQYLIPNNELMSITGSCEKNLFQNVEEEVKDIEYKAYRKKISEDEFEMIPWFLFCNYEKEDGLHIIINPLAKDKILKMK